VRRRFAHDALLQKRLLQRGAGDVRDLFGVAVSVVAEHSLAVLQLGRGCDRQLRHHPLTPSHNGNLGGMARLPRVPAPTIERLYDDRGVIWEVTYAGMTRRHRQEWQAWVYYEWARALYCASGGSNNRPS
jgi:hypothetical protein